MYHPLSMFLNQLVVAGRTSFTEAVGVIRAKAVECQKKIKSELEWREKPSVSALV